MSRMSEDQTSKDQGGQTPPPENQNAVIEEKAIKAGDGARGVVVMPVENVQPIDLADLPSGLPATPQNLGSETQPAPSDSPSDQGG